MPSINHFASFRALSAATGILRRIDTSYGSATRLRIGPMQRCFADCAGQGARQPWQQRCRREGGRAAGQRGEGGAVGGGGAGGPRPKALQRQQKLADLEALRVKVLCYANSASVAGEMPCAAWLCYTWHSTGSGVTPRKSHWLCHTPDSKRCLSDLLLILKLTCQRAAR
jgi:hypothetical protein